MASSDADETLLPGPMRDWSSSSEAWVEIPESWLESLVEEVSDADSEEESFAPYTLAIDTGSRPTL